MKKIILMTISAALIIASLFYVPENARPVVSVKVLSGEGFHIKSVDDFMGVMDHFMTQSSASGSSSKSLASLAAESSRPTEHTSGVVKVESEASIDSSSVSLLYRRELEIAMDENNSHYYSRGMLHSAASGSDGTTVDLEWDLMMLMQGDNLYLKFDAFTMTADGESMVDFSEIIGMWVQFPDEYANDLLQLLDMANRQSLESVQKLINSGLDSMEKNGDVYSAVISIYDTDDTNMVLDLSDDNRSSLIIDASAQKDGTTASEHHYFVFENIDRISLVCNLPDATVLTEEMAERIFGGDK